METGFQYVKRAPPAAATSLSSCANLVEVFDPLLCLTMFYVNKIIDLNQVY